MSVRDHKMLIHGGEITAFDMIKAVKWEAHRGLLSSVPTMLRHLREDGGINDPTLFLRRDHSMELLAGDLLRSFFNNQNKLYDMSVKKTREICAWRTPHVLACAIRNVVEFSAQPLVPSETCMRLLAVAGALRPSTKEKRIELVSEIVEDMSAWRFEILAALMSFLKDCSSPKPDLARELGPIILLRQGVSLAPPPSRGKKLPEPVREQNQVNDEMAAGDAFRVLMEYCDAVFGLRRTAYTSPPLDRTPPREHSHSPRSKDAPSSSEEKTPVDEEQASQLYEGIPAGATRRRTRSKKASSFYSIIARTSSNLSRESNSEPGSPAATLLKSQYFDRQVSRRQDSARASNGSTSQAPPAKRPSTNQPMSTMSPESSSWQERRPPPLVTSPSTSLRTTDLDILGNLTPLEQVGKAPNVKPQAIKTQTSFSSTSGNPLIKTQNSFSQNRPATPTSILAAKRSLLSDISSGNGATVLRASSPPPTPRPDDQPPPVLIEKVVPIQAMVQRPTPLQAAQPQQLSQSPVMPMALKTAKAVDEVGSSTAPPTAFSARSSTASMKGLTKEEMDADGPTIFEREMMDRSARRPVTKAVNPTPNKFEDELKRRASRHSLLVEEEEKKSEPPAPVIEAAAPPPVETEAAPPSKPKVQKPPKKPTDKRHSFIPRITSPSRKSDSSGKTFEQMLDERKLLNESPPPSSPSPDQASDSSEDETKDELNQSHSPEVAPSPSPTIMLEPAPAPRTSVIAETMNAKAKATATPATAASSFEAKLAARKAEMDTSKSTSSPVQQETKTAPQSFEAKLAARRAAAEQSTSPPPSPSPSSPPPANKLKSFQEQLAERRAQAESNSTPKPSPPSYPNPNRATSPEPAVAKPKPSPPAYPNPNKPVTVTATPPFAVRPKPVPPKQNPGLSLNMNQVQQKRASMTYLNPPPLSPPSPAATASSPEMSVDEKLANLRSLLKPAGSGAELPIEPPPPVKPDDKKRVPPPDNPPPPGHPRLEKEGGMQIVGDWRTEYSPQYKAQFWVNILTGAVQWHHPMRERSLSTKAREAQSKKFAPEVSAVTVKMPEKRRTIHENQIDKEKLAATAAAADKSKPKGTTTVASMAKAMEQGRSSSPSPTPSPLNNLKKLEEIGRQNSDIQKNLHKSYRRASIQAEDFNAQQAAQFDEAESMVIAAARAAGETVAQCVFDFTPVDPNNKAEMAVKVGEKLRIYEKGEDGWWGAAKVSDGRQRGLVPEAFLKVI